MSRFTERRPSASMVVALIALFVALSGSGVAVAAVIIPKNSVGNAQLKTDAVTTSKIKAGGVTGSDIRAAAVTGAKVLDRSLTGADVKDGSLLASDLKTGQIRQGARAYGTIHSDVNFVGSHPGLVSVTRPSLGVYCITAAAGVPTVDAHPQATVDWYVSSGTDNYVQVQRDVSFTCVAGQFEVRTYSGSGVASNSAGFSFLVP